MKQIIESLPFYEKLSSSEKELTASSAVIHRYEKGQMVHTCGQQCVGLVYVISGDLRLFLLSDEGREITLVHILDGQTCVLAASCVMSQITFHSELTAAKDTELLILPVPAFSKIMKENVYVRCQMYENSAKIFSDTMWVIQEILFHSIDRRVASFLIEEYEKTGSETLLITQENIAVEISTAREVVARMLKRFVTEGLIQNQRGKIILTDISALEEIAE